MYKSIRIYKSVSDAKRARTQLCKRNKKVSNVFKHLLNDKRFKNQLRFALLIS